MSFGISQLQAATSCDGKELIEATAVADFLLAMGGNMSDFEVKVPMLVRNGQFRNKLGETLIIRNRLDQASSLYLDVIERFTGSAFSSVR